MRSLFGLLVIAFVFIMGGLYAYRRMQQVPLVAPAVPPKSSEKTSYAEAKQAAQAVKFVGPLAEYMANQEKPTPAAEEVETVTWIPTASDHVGGSVVGSSAPILRKSFAVRSAVQIAFQVPAHAATPRLRGTFQSSAIPGGVAAPVEVLVLSDDQYSEFVNRRAGDAIFIAEDSPASDINARIPPTINQPARYHLIFRNNSPAEGKKFVKADFRMEF
jgi:hypothetical protein